MNLNKFDNTIYGMEGIDFDRSYLECETMRFSTQIEVSLNAFYETTRARKVTTPAPSSLTRPH